MSVLSDALLAGARSRRLLLEFALLSEARREDSQVAAELPLWKAVFDTQVASSRSVDARGWGAEHIPRPCEPARLARLLDRVVLVRVTDEVVDELDRALSAAGPSAGARGRPVDELLASPQVEDALRRLARHLASKRTARPLRERLAVMAAGEPSDGISGS